MADCRTGQIPTAMAGVGRGWTCGAKLASLCRRQSPCSDQPSDDAHLGRCQASFSSPSPPPAQDAALSGAAKGRELMAAGRYEAALPFFQRELDQAEAQARPGQPLGRGRDQRSGRGQPAGRALQGGRDALPARDRAGREGARQGSGGSRHHPEQPGAGLSRAGPAGRGRAAPHALAEPASGHAGPQRRPGGHEPAQSRRASTGSRAGSNEARPLQERAVAVADKSLGRRDPDTIKMRTASGGAGQRAAGRGRPRPCPSGQVPQGRGQERPATAAAAASPTPPTRTGWWRRSPCRSRPSRRPTRCRASGGGWSSAIPTWATLELQPAQSVEVAGKGTFYRVIAGPLNSKAAAEALCARLKKAGASCRLARS